jgi:two-component system chemotaxis sensor kinase CheA
MIKVRFSKYQSIIAADALFLVVDMGVLVMNFFIAAEIKTDASSVNLAGRQRMLSQRMAKTLYQLQDRIQSSQPIADQLAELKLTFNLFDTTLFAFTRGGKVKGGAGELVQLVATDDVRSQAILKAAATVWGPYRALVEATLRDANSGNIQAAVGAAATNNLTLLKLMNDLTTQVEIGAAGKAEKLRLVQAAGMILAILNFALILFHFLKQLRRSDQALEAAKQETDQILETVNEGLFLLDQNLRIGSQYSKDLEKLFNRDKLAHEDFIALLARHVSERTLQLVKDYVGLLLERRVNANLISDLNPLNRVEMNFQDSSGGLVTKYLDFRFRRVIEAGALSHILVTVSDATEQVRLEQSLSQANDRAEQQIKMVSELLLLNPSDLPEMIQRTRDGLVEVNTILRAPASHGSAFGEKLQCIYRIIHRIKGDAGAVGLSLIESHAHIVEDSLVGLRNKPTVTGNDFLPATVQIERLLALLDSVEEMLTRLAHLRATMATPEDRGSARRLDDLSLMRRLTTLAERAASRGGKTVQVVTRGLDDSEIPDEYRHEVQEIAQQFLRNAVVHGIEPPALRRSQGKAATGLVNIAWAEHAEGGFVLTVEDDGAGISLKTIRQRLIEQGMPEDQALTLSNAKLMERLFAPGFSTRQHADEDAGRGVGLDGVRAIAQQLGGRIRLHSRPGEMTRFAVHLPAPTSLADERLAV